MCACRIFKLCKLKCGRHCAAKSITRTCLMCANPKPKWSYHGNDGEYMGACIECIRCHDYIVYYDDPEMATFYKEEFYFDKFTVLKYGSYIIINDENDNHILNVPLFEFNNKQQLLDKIKTYIIFS